MLCLEPNMTRLSRMCRCVFSGYVRMNIDLHVYLLAKLVEDRHETVNGEALKLYSPNAGKLRMTDAGPILSLSR